MAKRHARRNALIYTLVICILLAALGGLSIYTVKLNGKVSQLTRDLASQKSKSAQSSESANDVENSLEAENAEQQAENDKLQAENDQLKTENDKLQAENDQLKTENAEQQTTIDKQQDTIADLKVQIALKNTEPGDPNLPEHGPYDMYEGQKIVALTFDDGPGPYTAELLDFLQQEGVRATFFVLGTRVDSYPALIRRMAAEGHEVGNHSNAHNMLHKMDLLGIRNEMGTCAEKIEKLLGYRPSVMRCPGGNKNDAVHTYATEAGIPIAYWSVDTRDWDSRNKDKILEVAFGKNGIKDGSIVLMHDIYKTTVEAAKEMILRLKEEGYVFVTTSELIAARRGGIVAGKQYS